MMKKTFFALAAVASCAAFADPVTSDATFAVLKVASTNTETVVSVPWEAVGGGTVKVKDFVKTTDMTEGDVLYLYDGSSYKAWVLTGGAWTGVATVKGEGGKTITAEAGKDSDKLARGQALIVYRQKKSDYVNPVYGLGKTPSGAIYLYGQYSTASVTYSMGKVTGGAKKATTLFAPVNTTAYPFYLNSQTAGDITSGTTVMCVDAWSHVIDGDILYVQNDINGRKFPLTRHNSKWGVYNPFDNNPAHTTPESKWNYDVAVIQPGMGAWYETTNATDAVSFTTKMVEGSKE